MITTTTRSSLASRLWALGERAIAALQSLQGPALLLARCYVGSVFFRSGLTKLRDWDTTVALFMDEYHVPLLNPTIAAFMGTAAEVGLPVLLAIGLGSRFAAAGLFALNIVAVLSLAEIADAALQGHIFWGSLLAAVLLWGPGGWSLDRFAVPWLRARVSAAPLAGDAGYTAARAGAKG